MINQLLINRDPVINLQPSVLSIPLEKNLASSIPDLTVNTQKSIQGKLLKMPALADFQKDEAQVKDYLKLALSLDAHQTKLTDDVLNQMLPGLIEKIILENSSAASIAACAPDQKNETLDLSEPIAPFLFKESYVKKNPKMELAVVGTNILSRGSSVITLGMLLNKIQAVITAKKTFLETITDQNERTVLGNEIDILGKWHQFHSELFSTLTSESITDTTFSLPKASAAIISLTKTGSTLAGRLIGWIGMGVGLIGYAYDWICKRNKVDKHDAWAKMLSGADQTAEQIYERQKGIYEKRLKLNLPELETFLKSILDHIEAAVEEKSEVLKDVLQKLKERGIVFEEEPASLAALRTILTNPAEKASLNAMMVKKKEMLSVSLRNALKTFIQKKNEIDKGFLLKEEDKASGFCILYAYITTWTIALESLLASGTITSAVVTTMLGTILTGMGYGTLVGVVVSVVAGSIYLYLKKPNIFKTYAQGVQLRQAFWNIPLGIQQFRKKWRQLEEMKVCAQVNVLGKRLLEADPLKRKELESKLKAKEEEWKSLSKQVSELNASISRLEEKVKPLQERIDEAGWKDFQLQFHGKSNKAPEDVLKILSKYLLQDATILEDDETKKILLSMGVDLNGDVATKLRAFFAMEVDDKMQMIKNRKLLEAHGIKKV